MTDPAHLHGLRQVADLIRERDIARFGKAQAQKSKTEALLRALDHGQVPTSLSPAAEGQVVERFGLWTANRRIVLNQQLARDTATWMEARDAAQKTFGRAEVLKKLLIRK